MPARSAIQPRRLESLADGLERQLTSGCLLEALFDEPDPGSADACRHQILAAPASGREGLREALVERQAARVRSEWSRCLNEDKPDVRFLHALAVAYWERALRASSTEPPWRLSAALWGALLSCERFWNDFSQARLTDRGTDGRRDLDETEQERLAESVARSILSVHTTLGAREFAAARHGQAAVHLGCVEMWRRGPSAATQALEERGIAFPYRLDRTRGERLSALASRALRAWCDSLTRDAEKALQDAEAIKALPTGIRQNYAGAIAVVEPFVAMGIPAAPVLRAGLSWYNDWAYDLYTLRDTGQIQKLMAPARRMADQLLPLCTKHQGHVPDNQVLSMHFLLRGFTIEDDPKAAQREYEEALEWNPGNTNARNLLGDTMQRVVAKGLKTAMECLETGKYEEARRILDGVEETSEDNDALRAEVTRARAVACFREGRSLARDGRFKDALKLARQASSLQPGEEVLADFEKQMEEYAPEETVLRHLRTAQEALEADRYEEALRSVVRVERRSKFHAQALRLRSAAHFYLGIAAAKEDDLDGSRKQLESALELSEDPQDQAIIEKQIEQVDKAIEHRREAPNARRLEAARRALDDDRPDAAIAEASEVPGSSSLHGHARRLLSAAHFKRGIAAANAGNLERARQDLQEALDKNDDRKEREIIEKQIEQVDTGIALRREEPNVRRIEAAQEALELGCPDAAIAEASEVPSSSALHGHARRLLSAAHFKRGIAAANDGSFQRARRDLQEALDKNDNAEERGIIEESLRRLRWR